LSSSCSSAGSSPERFRASSKALAADFCEWKREKLSVSRRRPNDLEVKMINNVAGSAAEIAIDLPALRRDIAHLTETMRGMVEHQNPGGRDSRLRRG
jgi:hypothetical protein